MTVPLSLPIYWAGKTPVITVDNLKVPGLGTFDARVVINNDKYAGTWKHGDVGGHLFGKIIPKGSDGKDKTEDAGADEKEEVESTNEKNEAKASE